MNLVCFSYLAATADDRLKKVRINIRCYILHEPGWPINMHCESVSPLMAERNADECHKQINLVFSMSRASSVLLYSLCSTLFPIPLAAV